MMEKKMLTLNLEGIKVFSKKFNSNTRDCFWNNYELQIWEKNINGYFRKDGSYKKNSWGVLQKISIEENGTWRINKKYVKYFK